jgi:hypothetical protein
MSHIYKTAVFSRLVYSDQTLDKGTWMGDQTFINTSNVNQYLGQVSAVVNLGTLPEYNEFKFRVYFQVAWLSEGFHNFWLVSPGEW